MATQKYFVDWKTRIADKITPWRKYAKQVIGFNGVLYFTCSDKQQAEVAIRGVYEDFEGRPGFTYASKLLEIIAKPIEDSANLPAPEIPPRKSQIIYKYFWNKLRVC